MNKQDAPARIEAKSERPAHPSQCPLEMTAWITRVLAALASDSADYDFHTIPYD